MAARLKTDAATRLVIILTNPVVLIRRPKLIAHRNANILLARLVLLMAGRITLAAAVQSVQADMFARTALVSVLPNTNINAGGQAIMAAAATLVTLNIKAVIVQLDTLGTETAARRSHLAGAAMMVRPLIPTVLMPGQRAKGIMAMWTAALCKIPAALWEKRRAPSAGQQIGMATLFM